MEYTLQQIPVPVLPASSDYSFLYGEQWDIDTALLQLKIDTDKENLLKELHHIIVSAVAGAEYCIKQDEWTPAVRHAVLISAYFDEEAGFNDMLLLLRQPDDYYDFWIGDWTEELIHPWFKKFAGWKLNAIKKNLLEGTSNNSGKIALITTLPQFTVYTPDARAAVIDCLKELLQNIIATDDNELPTDPEEIAFYIYAATDLHATELMEIIRELYRRDITDEFVSGSLEETEKGMYDNKSLFKYRTYDSVADHLSALKEAETENIYSEKTEFKKAIDKLLIHKEESAANTNIFLNASKNAPCPCGSGKKYKRCHGK